MLEEALEHLVKGIVDHPDDVRVDLVDNRRHDLSATWHGAETWQPAAARAFK